MICVPFACFSYVTAEQLIGFNEQSSPRNTVVELLPTNSYDKELRVM